MVHLNIYVLQTYITCVCARVCVLKQESRRESTDQNIFYMNHDILMQRARKTPITRILSPSMEEAMQMVIYGRVNVVKK